MPSISVVIPTYNRADLLARAIESVLHQTYSDFELIVVDDGSTDSTREVVRAFVDRDPRVIYLHQQNSGGAASPKNNAFAHCKGEYIAYLDHDDEWLPEKLEKQLAFFGDQDSARRIGLVSCNVLIVNQSKGMTGVHKMFKYRTIRDLLLEGGNYAFSNSSIMIPRKVVEEVGPRDESLKLFEDQDIFIRIASAGYMFDFVDDVLIKYYIDDSNLSKDFSKAAPDYDRFVTKHKALLSHYPDILGIHYRHLGTMYLLGGDPRTARKFFSASIRTSPTLRNIITGICALFGKRIYGALLDLKKKRALLSY